MIAEKSAETKREPNISSWNRVTTDRKTPCENGTETGVGDSTRLERASVSTPVLILLWMTKERVGERNEGQSLSVIFGRKTDGPAEFPSRRTCGQDGLRMIRFGGGNVTRNDRRALRLVCVRSGTFRRDLPDLGSKEHPSALPSSL